jgi:hypothetical protein
MNASPFSPSHFRAFWEAYPFETGGTSILERDAGLAVYLLNFLCITQDPESGAWFDREPQSTLRNVCHAVEAFYLLGPSSPLQRSLENGVAWLVNVSETPEPGDLDWEHSPRFNPSRFKNQAWTDHFQDEHVWEDFNTLGRRWHQDLLDWSRPYLATLIYLDTLYWLNRHQSTSRLSQGIRQRCERALEAIHRAWQRWEHHPETPDPFHSWQEFSYAFDILKRYGYLDDEHTLRRVRERLVAVVQKATTFGSESLYGAIQLYQHFSNRPDAEATVAEAITHLHREYTTPGALASQEFVFHCLVLRLLATRHGPELNRAMYDRLFQMHQENHRRAYDTRQDKRREELKEVLLRQLQIEIPRVEAISGGVRAEKVFEVEFVVRLPSYSEDHPGMVYESRPGRIIVKTGRYGDLCRAVEEYRRLPEDIRHLFATHGHDPIALPTPQGVQGYLIMEDLKDKKTLEAFLASIDHIVLAESQRNRLDRVITVLGESFRKIHTSAYFCKYRESLSSDHFSRLYLGPIENAVIMLSRGKTQLNVSQKLQYNDCVYSSLNHYLRVLEKHVRFLRPSNIGLVHGDCHTRNIMIDESETKIFFIDLDHMDQNGDYIDDYAIMLEDACLYRYLRNPEMKGHIKVEDIHHQRRRDTYIVTVEGTNLFTRALPQHFQRAVFSQIEQEARRLHDGEYWKPRLWLATGARLLLLAARVQVLAHALLLYGEALRLLHELEAYLDRAEPLPAVLFGADPRQRDDTPIGPLQAVVERIRPQWSLLDIHMQSRRCEFCTADGRLVALLFHPPERRHQLRLALALPLDRLSDLPLQVEPFASGPLQAVLDLPEPREEAASLVNICLQRATGMPAA